MIYHVLNGFQRKQPRSLSDELGSRLHCDVCEDVNSDWSALDTVT